MKDNDYNVKAEYWRRVITQCNNRSSDISKAEWLDQHGIAHATYYKWQRLLRDDAIEQINDQNEYSGLLYQYIGCSVPFKRADVPSGK